ncbi:MAG: signal peptide peptidase SppA [Planctomycetes bacterium]|jgi:protease-4|nr:signal peptide peptidase SppA [Planctomycetota bacterium]
MSQSPPPTVVYQTVTTKHPVWKAFLILLLLLSLAANAALLMALTGALSIRGGWRPANQLEKRVIRQGSADQIALVHITGLVDGSMVKSVTQQLRAIDHDTTIKAVVLRVDSPGGGVTDSDEIYHALQKLRSDGKSLVVSMGSLDASGGYYISMAGQELFAEPTTIVGSIGVMMPGFQITDLMRKIGIQPEFLTSSAAVWKEAGSPFSDYTPAVKTYLIDMLNIDAARFINIVKTSRSTHLKVPISQVANGKIWAASAALKLGLVDHIGYLSAAYHAAAKLAGIYNPTVVEFHKPPSLLDLISSQSAAAKPEMQLSPHLLYDLVKPRVEYLYLQ